MSIRPGFKKYTIVLIPITLLWSWLLIVDVGKLSPNHVVALIIAFATYILTVPTVAYVYILSLKIFTQLTEHRNKLYSALLLFFLWPLTEFMASWLPNLLWYGKGGHIDTLMPFTTFSLLIANTPLRYLFRLFGLFGTSGVIVAALYLVSHKVTRKKGALITLAIVFINFGLAKLYEPTNSKMLTVGITTQTVNSPQKVTPNDAKLIVLPEYGLNDVDTHTTSKRITTVDKQVYFVGSLEDRNSLLERNILTHGDTKNGFLAQQDKYRLIPGGEYLSFLHELPLKIIRDKTIISTFNFSRAVQPGSKQIKPYKFSSDLTVGSGICSSIIAPQDYRLMSRHGANILTNSASLDIFNNSKVYMWEANSMAKFIAAANARPFAQSANDGPSFILDSQGNTKLSLNKIGYAEQVVITNTYITPYTILGEWTVPTGAVVIFYLLYIKNLFDRSRKNKAKSPKKSP